jgi:hypothetical protein
MTTHRPVASAGVCAAACALASIGCVVDWDRFDPRLRDEPVPVPACGRIDALAEDWPAMGAPTDADDPRNRWFLTQGPMGCAIAFGAGSLGITFQGGLDCAPVATTHHAYDLRNGAVSVKIETLPQNGTALMAVTGDAQTGIAVSSAGTVDAFLRVGPTVKPIGSAQLVGTPLHVRVRESVGTAFFEQSADGAKWTEIAHEETAKLFAFDYVRVELAAAGDPMTSGVATFGAVNGGTPKGGWCPTGTLRDSFDDAVRARDWDATACADGCTVTELADLTASLPPGASFEYRTERAFDLTGGAVSVFVPLAPPKDASATLALSLGPGLELVIQALGDELRFYERNGMGESEVGKAKPGADTTWWRIREEAGTIHWETSGDGRSWQERGVKSASLDPTALRVRLGAGNDSMGAAATLRFDNYNITP